MHNSPGIGSFFDRIMFKRLARKKDKAKKKTTHPVTVNLPPTSPQLKGVGLPVGIPGPGVSPVLGVSPRQITDVRHMQCTSCCLHSPAAQLAPLGFPARSVPALHAGAGVLLGAGGCSHACTLCASGMHCCVAGACQGNRLIRSEGRSYRPLMHSRTRCYGDHCQLHGYRNHGFDTIRDNNGVPLVIENDEQLKQMSWYQPGIPREISLEILSQQEIGSFIIRDSSHQGCYALSVKVPKFDNPTGISHYLIVPTARGGVRLKGLDKEWPSMAALVTHHTVMPEMLPCTLRLPRTAANPAFNEVDPGNDNDREDDDDYQKLADCHTMMSELKL